MGGNFEFGAYMRFLFGNGSEGRQPKPTWNSPFCQHCVSLKVANGDKNILAPDPDINIPPGTEKSFSVRNELENVVMNSIANLYNKKHYKGVL